MTFVVGMRLTADGKQAKAELTGVSTEADKVTASATKMGSKGKAAATDTKVLSGSAKIAKAEIAALARSEQIAAQTAVKMGGANRMAGGSLANLTAQFNDIGVMMAAGQNPLQLALQQGTQITQVIGPMGAAGAVRALGSAFMQMLNPVSLITIGSIAAGAAVVQWLSSGEDGAMSLVDALDDLDAGLGDYKEAASAAGRTTDELRQQFGEVGTEIQDLLDKLADAEFRDLKAAISTAIKSSLDETELDMPRWDVGDQSDLADFFDLSGFAGLGLFEKETRKTVNAVLSDYAILANAGEASLGAQIKALENLTGSFETAAKASGQVSKAEQARLDVYNRLLLKMYELKALQDQDATQLPADIVDRMERYSRTRQTTGLEGGTEQRMAAELKSQIELQEIITAHGRESAEVENLRIAQARELYAYKVADLDVTQAQKITQMELWDLANATRDVFAEKQTAAYAFYAATRSAADADTKRMGEVITELERENELHRAILKHGENSVVVTELRLAAEAAVHEKKLATLDISQSQEDSLRAAFEESQRLSQIDMASGISAAAAEAYKLAESLGIAVNEALSLLNIPTKAYSGRDGDPRNFGENGSGGAATYAANQNYVPIDEWIKRTNRKNARGSGGGSKDEQQSIDDLIASLQDELAILQEIDPIQQEMLRNREVLATATDQERAAVEALISQRVREQQQMEDLQETREFFSETAYDALEGLILQGDSLADVMSNVASMIAKAALQAALLGEGPLASLFGGSSDSGGFLGSIFKIFTPKLASGGPIYGPGSGTSDDVPIWASNGEFMMNAAATAKNRHLLEAMNSGWSPPGYAGGGAIGSSAPANYSMPGQSQTVEFNVYATGTGNAEIEASAKAGMKA